MREINPPNKKDSAIEMDFLAKKIENDFPGIFSDPEKYITGGIIAKTLQLIDVIDDLVVFTPRFMRTACDALDLEYTRTQIDLALEKMYLRGYLGLTLVETGLNPAKLYWIKDHPLAEARIKLKEHEFNGFAEIRKKSSIEKQKRKTKKKKIKETDQQFKNRMKHTWDLQSDAAVERKIEKKRKELDKLRCTHGALPKECKETVNCPNTKYPRSRRS